MFNFFTILKEILKPYDVSFLEESERIFRVSAVLFQEEFERILKGPWYFVFLEEFENILRG